MQSRHGRHDARVIPTPTGRIQFEPDTRQCSVSGQMAARAA
ncbi:MAG: hypothetical protein J07HX64_00807 [halophilic archaeon J07HX64]|nr:MAG: hypothetical protein J07HX64_00807 [halophilic archaeon J07HX64]